MQPQQRPQTSPQGALEPDGSQNCPPGGRGHLYPWAGQLCSAKLGAQGLVLAVTLVQGCCLFIVWTLLWLQVGVWGPDVSFLC